MYSGRSGVSDDLSFSGDIEPDVDRSGYGARFGHIVQNVDGIRTVRQSSGLHGHSAHVARTGSRRVESCGQISPSRQGTWRKL